MKITIKKSDGWVLIGGGNTLRVLSNAGMQGVFVSATKDDQTADYVGIDVNYDLVNTAYVKTNAVNGVPLMVIPSISSTIISDVIPNSSASEFTDFFTVSVATSGGFITTSRSSNGQQYSEVSIDPLAITETQTIVEAKKAFQYPAYSEITASLSQRTKGDYAVMEITDKDTALVDTPIEFLS